jgi:two-component system phosphate regulon sensor histidine kinase PhoR
MTLDVTPRTLFATAFVAGIASAGLSLGGSGVTAAIACSTCLVLGGLGALAADRRARAIGVAAARIADGDLSARAEIDGEDTFARAAAAVNRAAREVSSNRRALEIERDRLALTLDGMSEAVLVVDEHRHVVLANRAVRTLALLGPEAIGKSVIESLRNVALQEAVEAAARKPEPVVREIELQGAVPRRLLARVTRLEDAGERPHVLAVLLDVTDLRRLETIRTDFVANVSHELRTPVTAISTAVETLLGGALKDPDDAAEFTEVIDRQAKRLRQLVDDLLDLAKIESKHFRLEISDVEVGPVIEHVRRLVEDAALRRKTEVKVEVPKEPVIARGDRKALEQIAMNLVDNAIKYAGQGAHVRLAVAQRTDDIEITVADDGPGIPTAHLGRIFERFYRVDAGRSRELGGTGLGLSIVKHLAELMHGSVEVVSQPGKGTRFTVRLPRARGRSEATALTQS